MRMLALFVPVAFCLSLAQTLPAAEPWAFEPGTDAFTDEALLDLRWLNEEEAGAHGWIRRSQDGGGFVRGDGETIRFWSITSNRYFPRRKATLDEMRAHAKAMAKRGVNMVRFHVTLPKQGADINTVDRVLLDSMWKLFAALKEEGIYSTISPYWAHAAHKHGKHWRDEIDGENVSGVLFYHPRLQQAYKTWLRTLLTETNPYTDTPLKDDPAFALLQIQNEDNLFWWTVKDYSDEQRALFEQRWAEWLRQRYGSLEQAIAAWDGHSEKGDAPEQGVVKLLHIWDLTQDLDGGKDKRADDQTRFFAELQYTWHEEVERFVREDIGSPVLINANNWKSAKNETLLAAVRWTYTANPVIATNHYFSMPHEGPKSG
jgi:hypothetical protein